MNRVSEIFQIQYALRILIEDHLADNGYIDFENFEFEKYKIGDAEKILKQENHGFEQLYGNEYKEIISDIRKNTKATIKQDKIVDIWFEIFGNITDIDSRISKEEALLIIAWINRFYNTTIKLSKEIKGIIIDIINKSSFFYSEKRRNLKFIDDTYILYDEEIVEPHLIDSLPSFMNLIYNNVGSVKEGVFFYRGHSQVNYLLLPTIYRKNVYGRYNNYERESDLYNAIQVKCFKEFQQCKTHLEKLVIMQHYGIPTRLLDVTVNPLVAMYFACSKHEKSVGEVVLLCTSRKDMKWPSSDTVTILSSLAALSTNDKKKLVDSTDKGYSASKKRLLGEIRTEKAGFENSIKDDDIFKILYINPPLNNQRIVNQQGAFLLFGLKKIEEILVDHEKKTVDVTYSSVKPANEFRLCNSNNKRIVVFIKNKKDILTQLKAIGIDQEHLFPEISSVASSLLDYL